MTDYQYNIAFLHGFGDPSATPTESISTKALGSDTLQLTKGPTFEDWRTDTATVRLADDSLKPIREVNRAYLHYIIDCWLDGKPLEYQSPGDYYRHAVNAKD